MNLNSNISQHHSKIQIVPYGAGTIRVKMMPLNDKIIFNNKTTYCNYRISQYNYVRNMCVIIQDSTLMSKINVCSYLRDKFDEIQEGKSDSNINALKLLRDLIYAKSREVQNLEWIVEGQSIKKISLYLMKTFLENFRSNVSNFEVYNNNVMLKPSELINIFIEPEIDKLIEIQVKLAKPVIHLILFASADSSTIFGQIPKDISKFVCKVFWDLACNRNYQNLRDF